jgi:alpha-tubulin suppressor-like RCC1 family protein
MTARFPWFSALGASAALLACTTELSVLDPPDAAQGAPAETSAEVEDPDASAGAAQPDADFADADSPGEPVPSPSSSDAGSTTRQNQAQWGEGRHLAAFNHTCVARSDGVYCWGENAGGQLGTGDYQDRAVASKVPILEAAREVCAGEQHSCALTTGGTLYCWGRNAHGELGLDSNEPALIPQQIPGRYARVACGGYVTCAIDTARKLWCWGDNYEGQVVADLPRDQDVRTPTRASLEDDVFQVSVGQGHACAVGTAGDLWCWGRNLDGQLGTGRPEQQVREPERVGQAQDFRRVAAAQTHTCGVDRSNRLLCWGNKDAGKLGTLNGDSTAVPARVAESGTRSYRDVVANWFHTCALQSDGKLACFGRNFEGQLGVGDTAQRDVPVDLEGVWDEITAGAFHTCARRGDDVWCWGKNDVGQLGLGHDRRSSTPQPLRFGP